MNAVLRKTHSSAKANSLVDLGWVIESAIADSADPEPYEYVLRWCHADPVPFDELAVVRVVALNELQRSYAGTESVVRDAVIGDIGAIVHCHPRTVAGNAYEVECVSPEGYTVWLATFSQSELALCDPRHIPNGSIDS